jgi:signal transduction histidine kinase
MVRGNPAGQRRDDLLEFAQAALSLRWLAIAVLIAYEASTPISSRTPGILYVGILVYALVLTLYAWRYPQLATRAARVGALLDVAAIAGAMQLSGHPQAFLYVGFAATAVAGLLMGHIAAAGVGGGLAVLQLPTFRHALFAPDLYAAWGVATLALQAVGHTAAAAAVRLHQNARVAHVLASVGAVASSALPPQEAASRLLDEIVRFLGADSGSLMVYHPHDQRLTILAAHHLDDAFRVVTPRLGEGIAGWVAQEGRPVLLTPETSSPFPLLRQDVGSSVCVPVISSGKPLGVLNLNRDAGRAWFSLRDLETATASARYAADILLRVLYEHDVAALLTESASGFTAVGRALTRDPAVLWPVLLDQARSVAAAQFAILALEREDTGTLDIVGARGISGQAALAYLPTLIAASTEAQTQAAGSPGTSGGTVVACIPLRVESKTIGALGLGIPDQTPASSERLQAVATQVAAAVQAARTAFRATDIGLVEERRRIAREMHDGLAQTLADALLQTDLSAMAAQGNPTQISSDLKDLRGLLERGMRELREFMSELRKEPEASSEFPVALEGIGKDFQRRAEIPTTVVITGDASRLPSAVRHAVLAIVRQALTNVRAHARATTVGIRAEVTDDACLATVTDNGVGFDLSEARATLPGSPHLGLTSMEERAALVGGRLEITTAPGRGTTIAVRVPLGGRA